MNGKGAALLLALLLTLAFPGEGPAAALNERLAAVQDKAGGGRVLEALEELRAAELELWRSMPQMALRKMVLVTEEPTFYGPYTPKADNSYRSGETVHVLAEPAGYTILEKKGAYSFGLTADFTLVSETGKIIGGQRGFGRWEESWRRPQMDYPLILTFDLGELSAGRYTFEILISDLNSDKTLKMDIPVVIAP